MTSEATSENHATPAAILWGRHIVGIVAVSAAAHAVTYGQLLGSAGLDWIIKLGLLLASAAAGAGLWHLFFTERSRGHFPANWARLAWVFVVLVAIGDWKSTEPRIARQSAFGHEPLGASAHATPARGERKVDEVRRLKPAYQGLSDAEIVRAVSMEYPDVPIEKIAADLGVSMPPNR